jgi:hypothetical protein
LFALRLGTRGMRSIISVFASDGGVVDEGVEVTVCLLNGLRCVLDAGLGVDVNDD